MGAEENKKLLATVGHGGRRHNTDQNTRPPALRSLVLTSPAPKSSPGLAVAPVVVMRLEAVIPASFPRVVSSLVVPAPEPAVVAPPASGTRPRLKAQLAKAARAARADEDRRRFEPTFTIPQPKRNVQNLVVAGIWAATLLLLAVLTFMATAA